MQLVKIYPDNPNRRAIRQIVEALRNGDIIIYPTDTLYAIGCDALNVRAVERICRIKGIDPSKASLSIVCQDLSDAAHYARIDNTTHRLMRKNLPGAFTFILPAGSELPKLYKQRKSVGVRVPDNNIARAIVEELGNPLLSTSIATNHDEPEYTTNPELIAEQYGMLVDYVIDGGDGDIVGSTIIDCTNGDPEIVREGKGLIEE
ncbi:MAG: threonylcarbamoyl-AMP synthase [Bacteroidaceae bacterium]|nr:threonylcarbamoyl-AMP synthase [Bacteroidaceae bacterium]